MIKIIVSQGDIDRGERAHEGKCPLALASLRAGLRKAKAMRFEIETKPTPQSDLVHYKLPREAVLFLSRFDKGEGVKPFSFPLPGTIGKPPLGAYLPVCQVCGVRNEWKRYPFTYWRDYSGIFRRTCQDREACKKRRHRLTFLRDWIAISPEEAISKDKAFREAIRKGTVWEGQGLWT
jgi:hypothetical protein